MAEANVEGFGGHEALEDIGGRTPQVADGSGATSRRVEGCHVAFECEAVRRANVAKHKPLTRDGRSSCRLKGAAWAEFTDSDSDRALEACSRF